MRSLENGMVVAGPYENWGYGDEEELETDDDDVYTEWCAENGHRPVFCETEEGVV